MQTSAQNEKEILKMSMLKLHEKRNISLIFPFEFGKDFY